MLHDKTLPPLPKRTSQTPACAPKQRIVRSPINASPQDQPYARKHLTPYDLQSIRPSHRLKILTCDTSDALRPQHIYVHIIRKHRFASSQALCLNDTTTKKTLPRLIRSCTSEARSSLRDTTLDFPTKSRINSSCGICAVAIADHDCCPA